MNKGMFLYPGFKKTGQQTFCFHQRKDLLISEEILPVRAALRVKKTVRRMWILILGNNNVSCTEFNLKNPEREGYFAYRFGATNTTLWLK